MNPAIRARPNSRGFVWCAAAVIAVGAWAAYHNSLDGPFLFDDIPAIVENPTIRNWSPDVLMPPATTGGTVNGRPVLNLSLAINYMWGGTSVTGYHRVNLLLHAAAALTLFGVVRRTVSEFPPALRDRANWMAMVIAVVWAVHPLLTSAVTYVIQRAEILAGLCCLLTLYALIRSADPATSSSRALRWQIVAVVACWAGMAAKETMAAAPLLALLYDRCFLAGSFREVWRRRWVLHAGLAASWLLLAVLVARTGARGGTVGYEILTMSDYLAVQAYAIPRYVGLAFWPQPLVFDYGEHLRLAVSQVAVSALFVFAVAVAGFLVSRRAPRAAFPMVAFFLLLAPSSSFIPIASQVMATHRMYLPLAAVVTMAVLAVECLASRRGTVAWMAAAAALTVTTVRRNADFRSGLSLWSDTVAKVPDNPRARYNLGVMLLAAGRLAEAETQIRAVVQQQPRDGEAHNKLGNVLLQLGRRAEAMDSFRAAIGVKPDYAEARNNLGVALAQEGRFVEAAEQLTEVVRMQPNLLEARLNLGHTLLQADRLTEAAQQYEHVLRLQPGHAQAQQLLKRITPRRSDGPRR